MSFEEKKGSKIKILEYLRKNPTGSIISDIAKGIGASRNTVYKYLDILEKDGRVASRKVGPYNLYFSSEGDVLSKEPIIQFYKGLLYALKEKFPNKYKEFKEVGKLMAKYFQMPLGYTVKALVETMNGSEYSLKTLTEAFEFKVYQALFQDPLKLTGINVEKNKTFRLTYSNSIFLESPDFIYHLYILIGYLEEFYTKHHQPMTIDVIKVNSAKKHEESYIELQLFLNGD